MEIIGYSGKSFDGKIGHSFTVHCSISHYVKVDFKCVFQTPEQENAFMRLIDGKETTIEKLTEIFKEATGQ